MIKTKFYRIREDGVRLYRSYSDKWVYIHKIGTNEVYSEAIDVEGAPYKYEDTDISLPIEELDKIDVNLDYYE